jgi:hypothetical protein
MTLQTLVGLPLRGRSWLRLPVLAAVLLVSGGSAATAIEMFTFYGDGSRVGLPSLEVPIEAYPGIPLRSDRIRARRRAQQLGSDAAVQVGPPGGLSIRAMPPLSVAPEPELLGAPAAAPYPPPAPAPAPRRWRRR